MKVEPTRSTRTPSPLEDDDQRGESFATVGDEVHRAGQGDPAAPAWWPWRYPTTDAVGQFAGVTFRRPLPVHAFCSVVSRDGSCSGEIDLDRAMFASVPCAPAG